MEWITDRLVELYLQYSLIGYIQGVGQQSKMSCAALMQHLVFHLPRVQVWTKCSCMHCYSLRWTHCSALRPSMSCLSNCTVHISVCVCAREQVHLHLYEWTWCADRLLMSASQATLQMEDTPWCWKGQGQTLRSQFTRKEPTKKGQVDTLLHSVRKTWAL